MSRLQQLTRDDKCPHCGGQPRAVDGFIVCTSCGTAIERNMVIGGYLRNVDIGNDPMVADSCGSDIGFKREFQDWKGRRLKTKQRVKVARLRIWQIRSNGRKVNRLGRLLRASNALCGKLGLSDNVKRRAGAIIKRGLAEWTNHLTHPLTLAAIIRAVREYGLPLTISEILDASPFRPPNCSINKALDTLQTVLGKPTPIIRPCQYIPRVVSNLKRIPTVLEKLARHGADPAKYFADLERAAREGLAGLPMTFRQGKHPVALAASVCYAFDPLRKSDRSNLLSQWECGQAGQTTEFTIRDHWSHGLKEHIFGGQD